MKAKPETSEPTASRKRMLLYARVSTEEQTKGNYPSCDSQIDELEAECQRQGWEAARIIKDEGYSAGSLKRPGIAEARWLVQSGQIDGVMCTWYDRLTRSRDFYTLDHEFRANDVKFITLHDAADTRTAAGRFMESMIVAAKIRPSTWAPGPRSDLGESAHQNADAPGKGAASGRPCAFRLHDGRYDQDAPPRP